MVTGAPCGNIPVPVPSAEQLEGLVEVWALSGPPILPGYHLPRMAPTLLPDNAGDRQNQPGNDGSSQGGARAFPREGNHRDRAGLSPMSRASQHGHVSLQEDSDNESTHSQGKRSEFLENTLLLLKYAGRPTPKKDKRME